MERLTRIERFQLSCWKVFWRYLTLTYPNLHPDAHMRMSKEFDEWLAALSRRLKELEAAYDLEEGKDNSNKSEENARRGDLYERIRRAKNEKG